MSNKEEKHKLRLSTKVIYGTGDFYGGASATIISMLFLYFLTDVVGMRPVYAGVIIFIGRFVDAITDPLMGRISDQTNSRFGRRIPYFLYFAIPVGLSFGLLWIQLGIENDMLMFVYYSFAYILFSISFTAVMVPYAALAPELTQDYHERTALISTRMAFSIIGALFAAVIPKTIIDLTSSMSKGYLLMGIVFGFVFVLIWLILFLHMKGKEIYQCVKDQDAFLKALWSTFKNKAFLYLVGIYLFSFIVNDLLSVNFIYYLTYYLDRSDIYTPIMGGLLLSAVVSLLAYVKLTKKYGKRKTYIIGASFWTVILGGLMLFGQTIPSSIIMIYALFLGLGMGVSYAIPWSMLPDVIDLDQVITGQRREGIYSGVMTFLRKLSSSLAVLLISFVLDLSGYIATTDGTTVTQPDSSILAIRLIISVAPMICLAIALYCSYKFPIKASNFPYIRLFLKIKGEGFQNIDSNSIDTIEKELSDMTGQNIQLNRR